MSLIDNAGKIFVTSIDDEKEATVGKRSRIGRPSAAETKERIEAVIQAARLEFMANGYRATKMDDIAARSGVSKRSLYFWYADKAALFRACVLEGAQQLPLPTLDTGHDFEDGLFAYTFALAQAMTSDYSFGMYSLLMREGREFPEIAMAIDQGRQYIMAPIGRFLEVKGITPETSSRLTTMFVTMAFSDIQLRMTFGHNPPTADMTKETVRDSVRIFVRGLKAFTVTD